MTIVIDDSRVINKLEASLTDNARVIIYDRRIFIVQAISLIKLSLAWSRTRELQTNKNKNDVRVVMCFFIFEYCSSKWHRLPRLKVL